MKTITTSKLKKLSLNIGWLNSLAILFFSSFSFAQNLCEANFTYTLNQNTKTAIFTNTSYGQGLVYFWSFGDGNSSTLANPSKTFNGNGTYSVCLTAAKPDSSCSHRRCSTIVVSAPCLATWTVSTASNNKLSKNFVSNNTSLDYYYRWTFGDGSTSDSRTPNHIYTNSGKYKVCLTVTKKDSSCSNTICDSINVTANTIPTCVSTWTFTTGVDNSLRKLFSSSNTSLDFNYVWAFGDGTSSDSRTPNHLYAQAGKYKVCLKVTRKDSLCTSTTCDSINVTSPNSTGCNSAWTLSNDPTNPFKRNFSSSNTSNDFKYLWTFGDGIASDSKTPSHIFPHAGKYRVCLKVSKKDSTCTNTTCDSINITAPVGCEANFTYTKTGREVHFVNTSGGAYNRSVWKFGDNTSSDQNSPTHNYSVNDSFMVCLFVYRIENGDTLCQSHKCVAIGVAAQAANCNASFTYGVNHNLRKLKVNSTSTGNNLIYHWSFGDDSTSNLQNPPSHIYSHNGVYRVCLHVTNALDTNCQSEHCNFITIHKNDSNATQSEVSAYYTYNTTNAAYNSVQFNSSSSNSNAVYSWNFGDGEFSSDANPLHSFSNKDWYLVCLSVSNGQNTDVICNSVAPGNQSTGISKVSSIENIKVFPNPFKDNIQVELGANSHDKVVLILSDISGKTIESKSFELVKGTNTLQFETSQIGNGVYILTIKGDSINKSIKVIK